MRNEEISRNTALAPAIDCGMRHDEESREVALPAHAQVLLPRPESQVCCGESAWDPPPIQHHIATNATPVWPLCQIKARLIRPGERGWEAPSLGPPARKIISNYGYGAYNHATARGHEAGGAGRRGPRTGTGFAFISDGATGRASPPQRREEFGTMVSKPDTEIFELLDSLAHGQTCPLRQAKRAIICWTLARTKGNVSRAAHMLGASRGTVYRYLQS